MVHDRGRARSELLDGAASSGAGMGSVLAQPLLLSGKEIPAVRVRGSPGRYVMLLGRRFALRLRLYDAKRSRDPQFAQKESPRRSYAEAGEIVTSS
jgi:hypothetical protein